MKNRRKTLDRRSIERRAPKAGVNVRHEDHADPYQAKRVRRAQGRPKP